MLSRSPATFPLEEVRDLLGLVRAIYVARRADGGGAAELARIAKVGMRLQKALALAAESRPGTVGMRAAWAQAESAALDVGMLVRITDEARPIVLAAANRIRL